MKNIIILILLGLVAYLLYTSGILNRAVQSAPNLLVSTPNPNDTPQISVTVYSPYGTGNRTLVPNATLVPQPGLTLIAPATSVPDVPIFVPPTPVVVMPDVPPTLPLPNTPTPAAAFPLTLDTLRDGATVNASPLHVTGVTAPNAIISVNDVVSIAQGDGRFDVPVPLQAGPNVLEIIASVQNGQQTFMIVTVMYQP